MSNIVNLLPVILVAVGALVTLAAEPFIKDDNKHKVLPWVASLFVVLGAGAYYLTTNDTFMNLYAMDPIRRVLGVAIILCAFLGVAGLQWTLGHEKFKGGEAYGLLLLATCGALLMTQAIDFLALYLGMELASFPIYALVGLRRKDINANEGAFKYFVSGAVFSTIFLYGVALVYGATGSTHIFAAVIAGRGMLYGMGIFLAIFALLFKAGAAPVHFWVADVYTGASVAVTGFMAAVVKVGALAALGTLWLGSMVTRIGSAPAWNLAEQVTIHSENKSLFYVIVVVSVLSMAIGAFGGLAQKSIRRIMAYSAVMNAGFIVLGLLLPDYAAEGTVQLGAMYYFLITYAVGSAGALTGIAFLAGKEDQKETLDDIRGRGRKHSYVALATSVCLASLAGMPPVAGFLAKFSLFTDALAGGLGIIAAIAFGLSLVAAVFYLRIAFVLFMPPKAECECKCCCKDNSMYVYLLRFGVTVAALALVVIGIFPKLALIE